MSTQAQIARIRARHSDHAGNPSVDCDACRALKLLDQAMEALDRIQEMASKSQLDPASVTAVVKAGKGPEAVPAVVHPDPVEATQLPVDAPAQSSPLPVPARKPAKLQSP